MCIRDRTNGAGHATTPGLGMTSARTAKGYYDLALSNTNGAGYIVTATAVTGTSQTNDTYCVVLGARVASGGNLSYGGSASTIDWTAANPDPNRCWAR